MNTFVDQPLPVDKRKREKGMGQMEMERMGGDERRGEESGRGRNE